MAVEPWEYAQRRVQEAHKILQARIAACITADAILVSVPLDQAKTIEEFLSNFAYD